MQDKKNQEKTKPLPEFEKEVTEILVANGRAFQPFIRTFSYTGENISKVNLGTLVGVFEVDEKSEDSAYIVNFLASVAKKEYFNNPRRGAIESFEAALHKVNLALAELVKHGNVAWLGKFHGALGVLEKNNLHFSVTGQARILLYRNGNLADISEGLASEESNTHPIKTFVEVSSGRLMLEDQILLSSPEIFSLFSLEDIEKNASRMDRERFSQFLKTALRNELDMSGTLLIDIKKGLPKTTEKLQKKKNDILPNIHNVFSQSAFREKSQNEAPSPVESSPSTEREVDEYIDTKTGHIYVQGDTPQDRDESPLLATVVTSLQDTGHSLKMFFSLQSKWVRKAKKQSLLTFDSLSEQIKVASRQTYRILRKQWKKKISEAKKEERVREEEEILYTEEVVSDISESPIVAVTDIPSPQRALLSQETSQEPLSLETSLEKEYSSQEESVTEVPSFIKEKLARFYRREDILTPSPDKVSTETKVSQSFENMLSFLAPLWNSIKKSVGKILRFGLRILTLSLDSLSILWQSLVAFCGKLSSSQKKIILGVVGGLVGVTFLGVYLYKHVAFPSMISVVEKVEDVALPPVPDTSTRETLESGQQTDTPVTITNSAGTLVAAVVLDNETYLITPNSIFHPRTERSYPLPSGSNARLASAMDDLRLIFVLTENNTLYAWSPINSSFTQNTLALPENAHVESIGTYLTYLYVLESTTDQIYRFPRAEGGFGQSVNWLRDFVSLEQNSKMAVNETIFLSSTPNTLQAYFRGRLTRALEIPGSSLSIASLYTHPGLLNIYALDKENKKITVWNQEGNLVTQYSNDKFGEGKGFTVNEQTGEIFLITNDNTLLSFKLKQ